MTYPDRECPICHRSFTPKQINQICCSDACGKKHRAARAYERKKQKKKCKCCGKEFIPSMEYKAYCSVACQMKTANAPTPKVMGICPICGDAFQGRKGQIYCSEKCRTGKRNKAKLPDKPAPKVDKINESLVKAKEMGLSYGQYKALEWQKKNRYIR